MAWDDDPEFLAALSEDEKRFYDEFEEDADGTATTEWGKSRRKAARADITYRKAQLGMDFIDSQPYAGWEMGLINAIDAERQANEANDIEPGIIRDGRMFRCSKWTTNGTLKAAFMDLDAAKEWMTKVTEAYNRLAR